MKMRLKHINKVKRRQKDGSTVVHYYYRPTGQKIDGKPGSAEFLDSYRAAEAGYKQPVKSRHPSGSMAALIWDYQKAPEYKQLAPKTQQGYDRIMNRLETDFGKLPVSGLQRRHVLKLRDKYADKPATANSYVRVVQLLLSFALDRGYITVHPALKIKKLKTGDGHRPWDDWEIGAFRAAWSVDTVERVAFELALNTGQRGGDIVKMTRRDIHEGWLSVVQNKTGERLQIPINADLAAVLDPWLRSHDHLVLLPTERGTSFKIDWFRHTMAAAYKTANLEGVTTHGLRYTAATILIEQGVDHQTIALILGHRTLGMAQKYTAKRRNLEKLTANRAD